MSGLGSVFAVDVNGSPHAPQDFLVKRYTFRGTLRHVLPPQGWAVLWAGPQLCTVSSLEAGL